MSDWLKAGLMFAGFTVWVIFFGTVVREMMRRRHQQHCKSGFDNCGEHGFFGLGLGYILGPFMWIMVVVYEVADGTTRQRLRERRLNRQSEHAQLRSAA